MRSVLSFKLLVFALLWLSGAAWGETYQLFPEPYLPAPGYDEMVAKLKDGDVIRFSDGRKFTLGQRLGSGSTTAVFELQGVPEGESRVIRIPLKAGMFRRPNHHYSDYIDETVKGHRGLEKRGIPVPRMYESRPSEFVVMEKLQVEFTLSDYLETVGDLTRKFDPEEPVMRDFLAFGKKTAPFYSIGDLSPSQIAYVRGKGWVLLDWISFHIPSHGLPGRTAFSGFGAQLDFHQWMWANWQVINRHLEPLIQEERKVGSACRKWWGALVRTVAGP